MDKAPILIIGFNRPDHFTSILDKVRDFHNRKIYISIDGPRPNNNKDLKGTSVVYSKAMEFKKNYIGEVKILRQNKNLGCKNAVVSGINWFFENVDYGIILEDDCLPTDSFFKFMDCLLQYYMNNYQVMHIGGTNPISDDCLIRDSYYFSNYNRIWGWATWKRAWKDFDVNVDLRLNKLNRSVVKAKLGCRLAKIYNRHWDLVYSGKIDTWDYQWFLYRLVNGDAIIPTENLISNIGFGEDATHTTNADSEYSDMPVGSMPDQLIHPEEIIVNRNLDRLWEKKILRKSNKLVWLIQVFQ